MTTLMMKGSSDDCIWWHIVVLLLAESIWMATCINNQRRQKRQIRNSDYLQQLRNARYLPPIPVRIPQYYNTHSESITRSPLKIETSPWIPIDGTAEAIPRKSIYVPPVRPPPIIVTRKPLKTSFNVPLTKSIQVSQAKPNIQTDGYIRKQRVKAPVTRTNKNSQLKTNSNLAESTIHSLQNLTSIEDGWRPKVLTTPHPTVITIKKLNLKNGLYRNSTGIRIGEVRPIFKMKQKNEADFGVRRNKTNFVMKFLPEDIKISSQTKSKNVETLFYPSSSEGKRLIGNQGDNRTFPDALVDYQKLPSNLRNEGNYPYQGHKATQQNAHVVKNGALNNDSFDLYHDWKTIYDSVHNTQNLRTGFPKKDAPQSQNQGYFVNDPYNAEIFNSAFKPNKRGHNENTGKITKQIYNNQGTENRPNIVPNSHEDTQNTRLEISEEHNVGTDQPVKSNFPYQGHASVVKYPFYSNFQHPSENIMNNRYQTQQTQRPSTKPVIVPGSTKILEKESGTEQVYDDHSKSSLSNASTDRDINNSFLNNQDLSSSKSTTDNRNLKYNSMSNTYNNTNTLTKEKVRIEEIPLSIENHHNISKSSNIHTDLMFKNKNKTDAFTNRQNSNVYLSSPKLQSYVPISNHSFSILHKMQNIRLKADDEKSENFAFVPPPNLKEVELKNPPQHLEFGDEDFLKPIVPIHFHKDNNPNKKLNTFKFSARDRSGELNKPLSTVNEEAEKILLKTSTEVPSSKVEYHVDSISENKKASKDNFDNVYFQPVFPEASFNNHQIPSIQKFQNYNNDQSPQQTSDISKKDISRTRTASELSEKEITNVPDSSREKLKINKDFVVKKNRDYSPIETKRNIIQGMPSDMPKIITPPPVITMKYDPDESSILGTRDSANRSDNYVIHRKPALLPENTNKSRKPKITLTTGMLAGILIAALIFLAFLTGSMVYAFHQWKFGRKKSDRQKKKQARSPRFPPEYLDENFAGNTYIHNNIFLPTPQNAEDRSTTETDATSMAGDEVFHEPTSTSARVRRHPGVYRETREE